MSKHSLKYNFNQKRVSIKFIIYIFLIVDIPMIPLLWEHGLDHFAWMILAQGALVFGLLLGTRGEGRYKEFLYDLRATADDPKYNDKEEMRGHILKQQVRHAVLEFDAWEFKPKNISIKIKKIKKNKKGGKIMTEKHPLLIWDAVVLKQFGYSLVLMLALFGFALGFVLDMFGLHWILVYLIAGTWEIVDGFLFFYIHYIFKIEPKPKKEIVI